MDSDELKLLLTVDDRVLAEEIQALLEEYGIFTILYSDNAASSIISVYTGLNPIECIDIKTTTFDYPKAIEILRESQYNELVQ